MSVSTPSSTSLPVPSTPQVDPYGVDLAIGPDGDFIVDASGSLAMVAGVFNCAQAIFLRYKTYPGQLPLHPGYGSTLLTLIGSKQLGLGPVVAQANADLQNMVGEDTRFSAAQIVHASTPANDTYPDSTALGVNATLIGGESVTLGSVTDPSPQDVSLPQMIAPDVDPTLIYDPLMEQEFFANDQAEFDQLQNLNMLQSIVDDVPGASILGTGG